MWPDKSWIPEVVIRLYPLQIRAILIHLCEHMWPANNNKSIYMTEFFTCARYIMLIGIVTLLSESQIHLRCQHLVYLNIFIVESWINFQQKKKYSQKQQQQQKLSLVILIHYLADWNCMYILERSYYNYISSVQPNTKKQNAI